MNRFVLVTLLLAFTVMAVAQEERPAGPDAFERDVQAVLNSVRTAPSSFLPSIDRYVAHVRSFTRDVKALTKAAGEIREILRKQKPLPILTIDTVLQRAARDHSADIAATGVLGHFGSDGSDPMDRVRRYGTVTSLAEAVTYGHMTPELIIASFLVDEGTPDRGHRKNLLNGMYTRAGIAVGTHPDYTKACVIVLSGP
jgi:uncharacterized protein YkwD